MSRKKENKNDSSLAYESEKVRIAIFSKTFMECGYIGPQSRERNVKCWKKDQIVRCESDIVSLILQDAPIEIFLKDDSVY